jgi:hypothetical protein
MLYLFISATLAASPTMALKPSALADFEAVYTSRGDCVWVTGSPSSLQLDYWEVGRSKSYLKSVTVVTVARDGSARRVRYFEDPDRETGKLVAGGKQLSFQRASTGYRNTETEPYTQAAPPLNAWTFLAALPTLAVPAENTWDATFLAAGDLYEGRLTWVVDGDQTLVTLDGSRRVASWLVSDGEVVELIIRGTKYRLADEEDAAYCLEKRAS